MGREDWSGSSGGQDGGQDVEHRNPHGPAASPRRAAVEGWAELVCRTGRQKVRAYEGKREEELARDQGSQGGSG